jgi:hypothetical protein
MRLIDAAGGKTDTEARERAAFTLVQQVDDMLETNLLVRETLLELKSTAEAVLKDVQELGEE